jgi:hypothetical protein
MRHAINPNAVCIKERFILGVASPRGEMILTEEKRLMLDVFVDPPTEVENVTVGDENDDP